MSRLPNTPVTSQPTSLSMDTHHDLPVDPPLGEKHVHDFDLDARHNSEHPSSYACDCESPTSHRQCRKSRLRHLVIPTAISLLVISALLFVSFLGDCGSAVGHGGGGLFTRAADSTGSTGGSFTHNKLYLIVIFVGLFLVLVLGIMLSAWCCRGSFENPCCCPCYLCACCGGLACLECIGCGLCAEGVDQI